MLSKSPGRLKNVIRDPVGWDPVQLKLLTNVGRARKALMSVDVLSSTVSEAVSSCVVIAATDSVSDPRASMYDVSPSVSITAELGVKGCVEGPFEEPALRIVRIRLGVPSAATFAVGGVTEFVEVAVFSYREMLKPLKVSGMILIVKDGNIALHSSEVHYSNACKITCFLKVFVGIGKDLG